MNPCAYIGHLKKEICIYWSVHIYSYTTVDCSRKHVLNQFLIANIQNIRVVRVQETSNVMHVPMSCFFSLHHSSHTTKGIFYLKDQYGRLTACLSSLQISLRKWRGPRKCVTRDSSACYCTMRSRSLGSWGRQQLSGAVTLSPVFAAASSR